MSLMFVPRSNSTYQKDSFFLFLSNLKNKRKLFLNKNNHLLVSSTVKTVYMAQYISLVLLQKPFSTQKFTSCFRVMTIYVCL
jgi:hypothetical protein